MQIQILLNSKLMNGEHFKFQRFLENTIHLLHFQKFSTPGDRLKWKAKNLLPYVSLGKRDRGAEQACRRRRCRREDAEAGE